MQYYSKKVPKTQNNIPIISRLIIRALKILLKAPGVDPSVSCVCRKSEKPDPFEVVKLLHRPTFGGNWSKLSKFRGSGRRRRLG